MMTKKIKMNLRRFYLAILCISLMSSSMVLPSEAKAKAKIYSTSVYAIESIENHDGKITIVSIPEFELAQRANYGGVYVEIETGSSGKTKLELEKADNFKCSLAYIGERSYRIISYNEFVDYWKDCKSCGGLWDNGVSVYVKKGKIVRLGIISS